MRCRLHVTAFKNVNDRSHLNLNLLWARARLGACREEGREMGDENENNSICSCGPCYR